MGLAIGTSGIQHFPCITNPQTPAGDPVSGGAAGATIGSGPTANALAACIGTLTINGAELSTSASSPGIVDLTMWGGKELVAAINALGVGVVASINSNNRLVLSSANPINVGESANVLKALGLSAQRYN